MKIRIQVLILYKLLIVTLFAAYQLLGLLLGLPGIPFSSAAYAITLLSLFSVVSLIILIRFPLKPTVIRNVAFAQFVADLLFISWLLVFTGGADSVLRFLYLAVIMLSAAFFEKMVLYAITAISLACYITVVSMLNYWGVGLGASLFLLEKATPELQGQFVLCFGSSLLASFMQTFYRSNRQEVKAKNEEVQRLQRIRKKIIETLPSGLLTCQENGQLSFINDVGRQYLGIKSQNLEALNIFEIFNMRIDSKRSKQTRIERNLQVDGVHKSFGVSYCPMELDQDRSGFLVVFQDLTQIKMLEAHAQLQDRMAAIGKMAAGVAHEIRNPLASISGSVQVIREVVVEDPEMLELADIVVNETKRLDNIISSFLAYARPGPPMDPEPVDLVDFSCHFIQLAHNDPRMKHFPIEYQGPESVFIMADAAKMSQIYWNLVRNAFQACDPDSGKIQISISLESDKVILSIQDNGIGMSESQLKDVFTPFQSFRQQGTGLGMAVVYENVRVHNGEIHVHSTPGVGTNVIIAFPEYRK